MQEKPMQNKRMKKRFDAYLPIVIDVETAGVNPLKDALLEIAAVLVKYNDEGILIPDETFSTHVMPFEGANIDEKALEINKIDIHHPFRFAVSEKEALQHLFQFAEKELKNTGCRRAVLVGHNAHFDLNFIVAATKRCHFQHSPFHAFTCFDTATLAGLMYGKTVLAKAMKEAHIEFDKNEAHSAVYDAQKTAELFCQIVNYKNPPFFSKEGVTPDNYKCSAFSAK